MAEEEQQPVAPDTSGSPEVDDAIDKIREYGTPIVTGVLAALVVVGGFQLYRSNKNSTAETASTLLSNAGNATQLQEITDQYSGTSSAPIAQLALAADYYSRGQYQLAQRGYQKFNEVYPDHAMRDTADYGLACCLEATGYLDEALESYAALFSDKPDHYLAPLATLGQGRVLTQLGRLEEARVVYEDFIASNPESPWLTDAESLLLFVQKDLRSQGAL